MLASDVAVSARAHEAGRPFDRDPISKTRLEWATGRHPMGGPGQSQPPQEGDPSMNQDTDANPEPVSAPNGQPTQWEYYRLSVDGPNVEAALHELGQNGWELVAVIPESRIFYGFQCFLKRAVAGPGSPTTERASESRRVETYVSVRT